MTAVLRRIPDFRCPRSLYAPNIKAAFGSSNHPGKPWIAPQRCDALPIVAEPLITLVDHHSGLPGTAAVRDGHDSDHGRCLTQGRKLRMRLRSAGTASPQKLRPNAPQL
jgi:hypothetical protein